MSIRDAIDELGRRVTHEEIAAALGVSVASVRQYRLATDAKAHRSPPRTWKQVLAALARERANELVTLADELENPDQLAKEEDWKQLGSGNEHTAEYGSFQIYPGRWGHTDNCGCAIPLWQSRWRTAQSQAIVTTVQFAPLSLMHGGHAVCIDSQIIVKFNRVIFEHTHTQGWRYPCFGRSAMCREPSALTNSGRCAPGSYINFTSEFYGMDGTVHTDVVASTGRSTSSRTRSKGHSTLHGCCCVIVDWHARPMCCGRRCFRYRAVTRVFGEWGYTSGDGRHAPYKPFYSA